MKIKIIASIISYYIGNKTSVGGYHHIIFAFFFNKTPSNFLPFVLVLFSSKYLVVGPRAKKNRLVIESHTTNTFQRLVQDIHVLNVSFHTHKILINNSYLS